MLFFIYLIDQIRKMYFKRSGFLTKLFILEKSKHIHVNNFT